MCSTTKYSNSEKLLVPANEVFYVGICFDGIERSGQPKLTELSGARNT